MRPQVETNSGLSAVLRAVVADMQHASGADIVSIFLYEEATRTYYAPFATGQPQESLLDSLTDMREQLGRYLADADQGKVPDDLGVHQYGSTVWLTVTRQRLVAKDAPSEIDSTFIRRYQVQSTIGLPLVAADRLLGLVYLHYRSRDRAPDGAQPRGVDGGAVGGGGAGRPGGRGTQRARGARALDLAADHSRGRRAHGLQRAAPAALPRARRPVDGEQPGRRGDLSTWSATHEPRAGDRSSARRRSRPHRAPRP